MGEPPQPELKTGKLWAMLALAAVYCGWIGVQGAPTRTGGFAGVFLGLYICSHPAANALDRLFFRRHTGWLELFRRAGAFWLLLNGAVLSAGWFVITLGATCLAGRPAAPEPLP